MSLRAVIFDVDGTLCETEDLHRRAFNRAFRAAGLGWHWNRDLYRSLLTTTGGKERIAAFQTSLTVAAPRLDAEAIARLHAEKTREYGNLVAAGLQLRPGIAGIMDHARRAGLKLAVATTTSRANVEALARQIWGRPADSVFDAIAAGDEVAAKKPAPDVYLLALARLNLRPAEALAFEDSANGLRAARAAGLATIVAPSVFTTEDDFSTATLCAASFADPRIRRMMAAPA
jgi:HAD superfamily hydrolase (TIGR01509 family)